jgi:hypothetical protein
MRRERGSLRNPSRLLPSLYRAHVSEHHEAADEDIPRPAAMAHSVCVLRGGHVSDCRIGAGLASLSSPAFHTARQQHNKEETPCDTDD